MLIWMCYKRTELTIIGMSTRADICQILGGDSQNSLIQTTTRPDHVWPEVWTKIGKAAQNREKQERAKEKPKLDNARKLRGI